MKLVGDCVQRPHAGHVVRRSRRRAMFASSRASWRPSSTSSPTVARAPARRARCSVTTHAIEHADRLRHAPGCLPASARARLARREHDLVAADGNRRDVRARREARLSTRPTGSASAARQARPIERNDLRAVRQPDLRDRGDAVERVAQRQHRSRAAVTSRSSGADHCAAASSAESDRGHDARARLRGRGTRQKERRRAAPRPSDVSARALIHRTIW